MTNRQKALEWFRSRIKSVVMPGAKAMYEEAVRALEQPEIIRCKDCTHNNNCEIQYSAQAGELFFCGGAERRKDE